MNLATESSCSKAGGGCRYTDTEAKGPFNSSLISYTGKLAHMCRNRAHNYARIHLHTKKTCACTIATHTEATAEWSQLERHRHFGLSTARISRQVRTTHKQTHSHISNYYQDFHCEQFCSLMQFSVVFFRFWCWLLCKSLTLTLSTLMKAGQNSYISKFCISHF